MTVFAGSATRQIFSSESWAISLPPTETQLVDTILPFTDMAMLEVPPPMSQDSIVLLYSLDLSLAPEPMAAITPSKFGPAVAATNFPASLDNISTISSAFFFLAVSPVIITAPV